MINKYKLHGIVDMLELSRFRVSKVEQVDQYWYINGCVAYPG